MKAVALCTVLFGAFLAWAALPASAAVTTDYDCADFANQAEAEENLLPGDPYHLDGDSDGIACEDLPCPCSSTPGQGAGGGGEDQPAEPPPPYHLKMGTAKHLSLQAARKFTRRNQSVTTTRLGACQRHGERRVVCLAIAEGETAHSHTTCHLRITVRAVDQHPKATLSHTQCSTRSTP